jgi:hypothetical protein
MSLFGQTLILYLVVGAGVAGAVYLSQRAGRLPARWFLVATAVLFWPLYLPMLLSSPRKTGGPEEVPPRDELAAAIRQVDAELKAALGGLDGWAEGVLIREKVRPADLSAAWLAQARRIREMDRVLAQVEQAGEDLTELFLATPTSPDGDRLQSCRQARRENVERLLRQRAHDDLMGSLAWARELVSLIHLARFSGAPAARAEELVAQIAAAVESLPELTWQQGRSTGEQPPCEFVFRARDQATGE